VCQKIESGELMNFGVRVRVLHDRLGEVGHDYLWNCIYASIEEFEDHRECKAQERAMNEKARRNHKSRVQIGSYFSDMIRCACAEARKNILAHRTVYIRTK